MAKVCIVDGCWRIRPCPVHKPKRSPSSVLTSESGWKKIRQEVLRRDNNICRICGRPATEVHHRQEAQWEGTSSLDNLIAVCHDCHRSK